MPIVALAILLLQAGCCVHVVRTRREFYWLFIIMMFPLLGCGIYFATVILPELRDGRAARQAAGSLQRMIDPDRDLRQVNEDLETADTVENRKALAEEHMRRGDLADAIRVYQSALTGIHRDDPAILMGLARAQFGSGDAAGCIATLNRLTAANPRFNSADGHLLYARALEAQQRVTDALNAYHAVVAYYPGGEAKCRYALLLQRQGHHAEAKALFQDVVRGFEKAKPFQPAGQREWYDLARQNLAM